MGAAEAATMVHQFIHDAGVALDVQDRIKALQPEIDNAWARGDSEVLVVTRIAVPKRIGLGEAMDTRTDGVFIGGAGKDRQAVFDRYRNGGPEFSVDRRSSRPPSPLEVRKRETFLQHYDLEEYYCWFTAPSRTDK
jgi:hypothetical protein